MKESSTVRDNLMTREGYTPYCASELCAPRTMNSPDRWLRTNFNGEQFVCPKCNWISKVPKDFIDRYKAKWNLTPVIKQEEQSGLNK
jgi:hypothetical protein